MKFTKYLLTFIAGLGLMACSDTTEVGIDDAEQGVPTYMTLSIQLPGSPSSRALPEDCNPDGDYEGNDGVETLDVYIVSGDGTIDPYRFAGDGLAAIDASGIIEPSQPFRTTSGTKTIYVVVNSPTPLNANLVTVDTALISVNGLAELRTVDGTTYDVITMTGKVTGVSILPDITQQAVVGGENRVTIDVTRMASRAIVTSTAANTITDDNGTTIGTLSDVTYSIAQGTDSIYFLPRANYVTYGYNYVPETDAQYIAQAEQYYDYSDLLTPSPVPAQPAAADGYKSLPGKFLFENTHASGDLRTTQYRKGNTAYVLVRATFTPDPGAIADGATLTNGTFYVGQSDGLIYSSRQAAQAAVQNQRVALYENGKMLYYAWLNPDNISLPLNSPVIRNNIYHVNITGFSRIGYNWNPLYPEDPDSPNPANPDPKPSNPDEPESPIDPTDPLSPEQTYMTVEVNILNWLVHSYDIQL